MRQQDQLALTWVPPDHPHARELEVIGRLLDSEPRLARLVAQDLTCGVKAPHTGAPGLTADQVLRIVVLKQMNEFSYETLAFHLADSLSYRAFCRLGAFDGAPARSTLAENVGKLRAKTLEKVNRRLVRRAVALGVEDGRRVRTDSTVTETAIHHPKDSTLLLDGVRVLVRLLERAEALAVFGRWSDHTKRAKRRTLAIEHAGSAPKRAAAYRDLLKVTRKTLAYAEAAAAALEAACVAADAAGVETPAARLGRQLRERLVWVWAVVDQTERRVLQGESVPAGEKVVSLFEPHTDVIVKDGRRTHYGHKVFLSTGASGLVTDCLIADGNPADTSLAVPMLRRHARVVGRVPRQAAMDGGFASTENLRRGKALGIEDLCFAKKRNLAVPDMVRSSWVYRRLRDFRAGIEGIISFLKRAFGLDRCTWKGREAFDAYVWASIVSANLLTIARHLLT